MIEIILYGLIGFISVAIITLLVIADMKFQKRFQKNMEEFNNYSSPPKPKEKYD